MFRNTKFSVIFRASDHPHGRFRIASNSQRIAVEDDLRRVLSFTIHRTEGTFGDVRVNYQLVYSRNYPGSLNAFVDIRNAESDVSSKKDILVEFRIYIIRIYSLFSLKCGQSGKIWPHTNPYLVTCRIPFIMIDLYGKEFVDCVFDCLK